MATLQELQRENRRLRAITETEKEMKVIEAKRKRIAQENFRLKHRKKFAFLEQVSAGAKRMGKDISKMQKKSRLKTKKKKVSRRNDFPFNFG